MKITRITVYQVTLPLAQPYKLSGGRLSFERLDSTIVSMETACGLTGWGEGCPWGSTYLPAFGKGIRAGIEIIAPQLLGLDPCGLDLINRVMDQALPGHLYVKSPLDIACWDVLGKAAGLPLCMLLGGRRREPVVLHSSIPTAAPEEMLAAVAAARHKGYRIHSCKVGGSDISGDIARIGYLIDNLPEGESLTFDANRSWLPNEAIQVMNATAALGGFYEQPCETLEECLQVRRLTRQPMALDESIQQFQDVVRAQAEGICEVIGLKVNRVGGLTKARRIRDFCLAMGLHLNIEETGGSVLADTAAVHLAQATPVTHVRGTWLCHDMLSLDLAPGQGARNLGGNCAAPNLPGIGVEPDRALLGAPVEFYH